MQFSWRKSGKGNTIGLCKWLSWWHIGVIAATAKQWENGYEQAHCSSPATLTKKYLMEGSGNDCCGSLQHSVMTSKEWGEKSAVKWQWPFMDWYFKYQGLHIARDCMEMKPRTVCYWCRQNRHIVWNCSQEKGTRRLLPSKFLTWASSGAYAVAAHSWSLGWGKRHSKTSWIWAVQRLLWLQGWQKMEGNE